MQFTLEIYHGGLGLALAFFLGRNLEVSLAGALLSALVGGAAIPAYFVSSTLLRTGPDLLTGPNRFDRPFSEVDVHNVMTTRAYSLLTGLIMAAVMQAVGWSGLAISVSMFLSLASLLWVFGINLYFWTAAALVGAVVYIAQQFGLDNAPLVALMFLSCLNAKLPLTLAEQVSIDDLGGDLFISLSGLFGGILPAINGNLLTPKESEGWLVSAIADGFSIGVCLMARDSSKSAVGTLLSQFAPDLDPTVAIVVIGLCLWFCRLPGSVKYVTRRDRLPKWSTPLIIIGASSWYASIPGQPFLSLCLGGLLYASVILFAKYLPAFMPPRFQLGLGAAPTLLL
jgi:hypothetical protein